jgi:myo-inositol-1(or 4)-monophosphatase
MLDYITLTRELYSALDHCRALIQNTDKLRIWKKQRDDGYQEVVTNVDILIENSLKAAVSQVYQQITFIAEESYIKSIQLKDDLYCIIDPLDGTGEFIAGRDNYAISIAIVQQRRLIFGILDFPARSQRFQAIHNQGITLNGRDLSIPSIQSNHQLRIAVSTSQMKNPLFAPIFAHFKEATMVPVGAFTPKIASILRGEADAAFYLPQEGSRLSIWDYAAAALILAEADIPLTDLEGNALLATLPLIHTRGWVSGFRTCHESITRYLRQIISDPDSVC